MDGLIGAKTEAGATPGIYRRTGGPDGIRDILILRSANPHCLAVTFVGPEGDLDGMLVLDIEKRPLAELADFIERQARSDEWMIPIIEESFPSEITKAAIHERSCEHVPGYSDEQLQALRTFLSDQMPGDAFHWLERAFTRQTADGRQLIHNVGGIDAFEWCQFFSSGDRDARAQAAWKMPIHAPRLPGLPGLIVTIDKRKAVLPALTEFARDHLTKALTRPGFTDLISADDDDLARSMGRKLLKLEAIARSEDCFQEGGTLNRACDALMIARDDQLPADWSGVKAMMSAIQVAQQNAKAMNVTMAPFLRRLSRVRSDGWHEALEEMTGLARKSETADFMRTTTGKIAGGMITALIRDVLPTETYQAIATTAGKVWARDDISPGDAGILRAFTAMGARNSYFDAASVTALHRQLASIVGTQISNAVSLKDLDGLQERWHHNQPRMESQSMSDSGGLAWEPLAGRVLLGNCLVARELTDSAEFHRQGEREKHCVGGHAIQVLTSPENRLRLVFSIETGDDSILSTVEVHGAVQRAWKDRPDEVDWTIAEHKARGNAEPEDAARQAVTVLVDRLQALPVEATIRYADRLQVNPGNTLPALQLMVANFQVNATNPDIPEIVLSAFDAVLPKALRGHSIDDWIAAAAADPEGEKVLEAARVRIETAVPAINQACLSEAVDEIPNP